MVMGVRTQLVVAENMHQNRAIVLMWLHAWMQCDLYVGRCRRQSEGRLYAVNTAHPSQTSHVYSDTASPPAAARTHCRQQRQACKARQLTLHCTSAGAAALPSHCTRATFWLTQ